MLEKLEKDILEQILEGVDFDNIIQVIFLVVIFLVVIASYARPFFATNLELLLMSNKEEKKHEIAMYVALYVILTGTNCFLISDATFAYAEICVLLVIGVLWFLKMFILKAIEWVRRIKARSKKVEYEKKCTRKSNKFYISLREYVVAIVFPLTTYVISQCIDINVYNLALLVTAFEVVVMLIVFQEFTPKQSHILIKKKDGTEILYVYKKMGKEYLLCGDKNKMLEADRVVTIPIADVFRQEYYLAKEKDDGNKSS